jgi:hypothetical protein
MRSLFVLSVYHSAPTKKVPVGKFKGRKEDFKIMTIISQVKCQEIRMDLKNSAKSALE